MSSGIGVGEAFKKSTGMGAKELTYSFLGPVGVGYGVYRGQQNLAQQQQQKAQAQSGQQAQQNQALSMQLSDERRRRKLLLLNPSQELQSNIATGRSQLLGV